METRRRELIEQHLHLVEPIVRRIAGGFPRFVDRDELVAAGHLGLTEAAVNFDFDRGVPFAPFAARRVSGAVLDAVRADDWTPRRLRRLARTVEVARQALVTQLHREPTDEELAAELGVSAEDVSEVRRHRHRSTVDFLDRRAHVDGSTIGEQLSDPTRPEPAELVEGSELHGYLRAALDLLPERLRFIVVGHYLEGRQLDELAGLLGVTPSRVSQLRADALTMIREGIDAQFATDDADAAMPTGRAAARKAAYAASIARHSDWRHRMAARGDLPLVESAAALAVPA